MSNLPERTSSYLAGVPRAPHRASRLVSVLLKTRYGTVCNGVVPTPPYGVVPKEIIRHIFVSKERIRVF